MEIQRICQHCGKDFIAQRIKTKYCGDVCAKRAYKGRKRKEEIGTANEQTKKIRTQPIEQLKAKEFLMLIRPLTP